MSGSSRWCCREMMPRCRLGVMGLRRPAPSVSRVQSWPSSGCRSFIPYRCMATEKRRPPRTKQLSRRERRLLERNEKKQIRRKDAARDASPSDAPADAHTSKRNARLDESPWKHLLPERPSIPGGYSSFHRDHVVELAKRLPIWIALALLVSSEDTSPFVVTRPQGPSMLPTIHPIGDVYLSTTGAWSRLLQLKREYKVGDIILWRDPETKRSACKRIVGVGGHTVLRYGQHIDRYKDREDRGILSPSNVNVPIDESWDKENSRSKDDTMKFDRQFVVPPDHVWLEGDFPPFSLDSRHYGPVPVDLIHGRLVCRLWPLGRSPNVPDISVSSGDRPTPLSLDVALSGIYNLQPRP